MSRPQLFSRPSSVAAQSKTIVLISGGNAGLGLEMVKSISKLPKHQVLMGCRDTHKGETAAASLGAPLNVNPIQLDVTDDASIEHAYLTIAQMFGKLDILINNAGTGGQDLPEDTPPRQKTQHQFNVNVISATLLTEKLAPLLEKAKLPKVIFISSEAGSIRGLLDNDGPSPSYQNYAASKAAMNYYAVWYSKKYPKWKVNAVCPGFRATAINGAELNEETKPALGAVRVAELVKEGSDGVTGTFSNTEGPLPW